MGNHAGNSYLSIKIGKEYHRLNINWTLQSKGFKLGYLAGMIDGEGFISIEKSYAKGKPLNLRPRIAIYNTNKLIIERCKQYLEDLEVSCHILVSNPKRARTVYKTLYRLDLQGIKRVRKLLKYIIPFLEGKKEVAETVLQFIDSRLSVPMTWKNQRRGYTEQELALHLKIKEFNRRGKDKRVLND